MVSILLTTVNCSKSRTANSKAWRTCHTFCFWRLRGCEGGGGGLEGSVYTNCVYVMHTNGRSHRGNLLLFYLCLIWSPCLLDAEILFKVCLKIHSCKVIYCWYKENAKFLFTDGKRERDIIRYRGNKDTRGNNHEVQRSLVITQTRLKKTDLMKLKS